MLYATALVNDICEIIHRLLWKDVMKEMEDYKCYCCSNLCLNIGYKRPETLGDLPRSVTRKEHYAQPCLGENSGRNTEYVFQVPCCNHCLKCLVCCMKCGELWDYDTEECSIKMCGECGRDDMKD